GLDEVDLGRRGNFGEQTGGGDGSADDDGQARFQTVAVAQPLGQSGKAGVEIGDEFAYGAAGRFNPADAVRQATQRTGDEDRRHARVVGGSTSEVGEFYSLFATPDPTVPTGSASWAGCGAGSGAGLWGVAATI